ncbi:MAG: hypothetical protein AAFO95_07145 [Cyanobacteria bacterium J06600_6]
MTLEQQLQVIIDDAPDYGIPSAIVAKAIAPSLKSFAEQLQNLEYYILQNLDGDWVLTIITNPRLQQDKRVIYAFTSVQDAANFQGKANPNLVAAPISSVQLLFRLFSLQQVDSIIFLDRQNLSQGIEIERSQLSKSIKQQLEKLKQIPPHIA